MRYWSFQFLGGLRRMSDRDRADWREVARPAVRSVLALVVYLRFGCNPATSYEVADQFIQQYEQDAGLKAQPLCVHKEGGTISDHHSEWLGLKHCTVCQQILMRRQNSNRYEPVEFD